MKKTSNRDILFAALITFLITLILAIIIGGNQFGELEAVARTHTIEMRALRLEVEQLKTKQQELILEIQH